MITHRAKRVDTGSWVYGYYCTKHTYHEGQTFKEEITHIMIVSMNGVGYQYAEIDPNTLCIGVVIQDKSCNELLVWENDIYQWTDSAYGCCRGVVNFGRYLQDGSGDEYPSTICYGLYLQVIDVHQSEEEVDTLGFPNYLRQQSFVDRLFRSDDMKVIGNIFDNELLGELK